MKNRATFVLSAPIERSQRTSSRFASSLQGRPAVLQGLNLTRNRNFQVAPQTKN